MKKLLLILVAGGGLWWVVHQLNGRLMEGSSEVSPSPTMRAFSKSALGLAENEASLTPVTVNQQEYRFAWTLIDDPSRIRVGVNEGLASESGELQETHHCTMLTSGAFYGTNDRPIGLVIAEGKVLSPWQQNQLFNGVLGMRQGSLLIREGEQLEADWAVQAGPILIRDGQLVPLKLKNDQSARRIVAGVTDDGKLFLAVIVAKDSLFEGPKLMDLPQIVGELETITGIGLQSALNLDGGTASAYLSPALSLKELKPIGSYICYRK